MFSVEVSNSEFLVDTIRVDEKEITGPTNTKDEIVGPTSAFPGTNNKIKVLEERASRRLPLWVKGDAPLDVTKIPYVLLTIFSRD